MSDFIGSYFLRWHLVVKECWYYRRITFLIILNLFFGITALLVVQGFKNSLEHELSLQSKNILSADLAISCRRPLSDQEKEIIHRIVSENSLSEGLEFLSMVSQGDRANLVEIKGIDVKFPLIGALEMAGGRKLSAPDLYQSLSPGTVAVYPELLESLNLKVGDSLALGQKSFRIIASVAKDSAFSFRTSAIAGRVYMRLEEIPATGLITERGATSSHIYFVKLKDENQLNPMMDELNKELTDPAVQVTSHQMAAQDTGRILSYLVDYLGLVALVCFLLANLGSSFLFRKLLVLRLRVMGVYRALGDSPQLALSTFFLEMWLLVAFSFVPAAGVSMIFLHWFGQKSEEWLGVPLNLHLSFGTLFWVLSLNALFTWLIVSPMAREAHFQKVQQLLNADLRPVRKKWFWGSLLFGSLITWGLAIFLSHSVRIGSLFTLVFLGLCALFLGVSRWVFHRWPYDRVSNIHWRLVFLSLARRKRAGLISVVALALGTLLLIFIPQIQRGLLEEIAQPKNVKVPDFFLFDIQPEQLKPLEVFLKERGLELKNVSPMVRARLLKVNGEPFEKKPVDQAMTREQEREYRFRNRGFNLSYRHELSDSEQITEGAPFSGRFDSKKNEPAEVSVEKNFADRLTWKRGDLLEFDVQGVSVLAKIINFRKVKWTSFQPNFFVQFQEGVLEEAPQIFLGSLQEVSHEQRKQLQIQLIKNFPNISLIDVSRLVQNLLEIGEQMATALQVMAILSVMVGFVVLFAILSTEIASRLRDLRLLRLLGFSRRDTIFQIQIETSLIVAFATLLGSFGAYALSWLVAYFIFDRLWSFSWDWVILLSALQLFAVGLGSGLLLRALVPKRVNLENDF